MTKKDFELIARVLRERAAIERGINRDENAAQVVERVADRMARALGYTNPRFNAELFLLAARESAS